MGIIRAAKARCALGSARRQLKTEMSVVRQDLKEAAWDAVKRVLSKAPD